MHSITPPKEDAMYMNFNIDQLTAASTAAAEEYISANAELISTNDALCALERDGLMATQVAQELKSQAKLLTNKVNTLDDKAYSAKAELDAAILVNKFLS